MEDSNANVFSWLVTIDHKDKRDPRNELNDSCELAVLDSLFSATEHRELVVHQDALDWQGLKFPPALIVRSRILHLCALPLAVAALIFCLVLPLVLGVGVKLLAPLVLCYDVCRLFTFSC